VILRSLQRSFPLFLQCGFPRRIIILIALICFNGFSFLYAEEITEGNIQLIVNEKTGGFLLRYRGDPESKRFEPLFTKEQKASFASVSINGKINKLSDRIFRRTYQKQDDAVSFIYESSLAIVTKTFTLIKTGNSYFTNGVKITFTIQNISDSEYPAGLRFLIDTDLGEGIGRTPFITDNLSVKNERLITDPAESMYWISRGRKASLMGSMINPDDRSIKTPDVIYFANWKRLYDTPWQIRHSLGRSFGGDSAVCYFYEPEMLGQGESITYTVLLTAEDIGWYNPDSVAVYGPFIETETDAEITAAPPEEKPAENEKKPDAGLLNLVKMQGILNQFINGEIDLTEQALDDIEDAVRNYR